MTSRSDIKVTDRVASAGKRLYRSIWFFPVVLAAPLIILTLLQISGTSMGLYHQTFYGNTRDPALILNAPRPIRSDEWTINSQMIIAQKADGYARINQNTGNGQDMSLIVDVPYKEWSTLFKPHDLGFFFLPFDTAFALRWWIMGYLLIVSCYFFVLAMLPRKRLLASIIGMALFFSPFVQWWYLPGTMGTICYSLFAATILIKIINEGRRKRNLLWGAALAYVIACFALLLYPPFQIPCALVLTAFGLGYLIEKLWGAPRAVIVEKLGIVAGAVIVAGIVALLFVVTRQSVINTVSNTAYPGKRNVASGGYNAEHLLSSHLSYQLQSDTKAATYIVPGTSIANQSEDSNFILLVPFLLIPGIVLLVRQYIKNRKIDWPLLALSTLFVVFLVRLFVPHTDLFFKPLFLQLVPQNRLIIGLGLLSFIYTVLIIRNLARLKRFPAPAYTIYLYVLLIFAVNVWLGLYARDHFPGFIHTTKAWLFALPVPIIIYLLLIRRATLAMLALLLFSVFCTATVNPLYHGTSIITDTPLSHAIRDIARKNDGVWVSETSYLQNFPIMNGAHSLTGVYTYPQLDLWADSGAPKDTYNRYAHTNVVLDRDTSKDVPTSLLLAAGDNFGLITEPCSAFLLKHDVHYAIAELPLNDSCAHLLKTVTYPTRAFYIYRLH
ncbi:MAG TPA: hypothetical protein VGO07_05685 [Candidatus Saccharimonadales bacterium]|jgi:hypothetical protein|nr:hypothetical protein [Candidatus Saccharimonadales bacterium]